MTKIKFIVFDLGNVLYNINLEKVLENIVQLSKSGKSKAEKKEKLDKLIILNMIGSFKEDEFLHKLITELKIEETVDMLKILWNKVIINFREEFKSLLFNLKKNYNVALLSNTDNIHYEYILNQEPEFENYFDSIFLSYKLKKVKPSQEIFETVLNEINIPAQSILFFDDMTDNIISAKNMGINGHVADNFNSVLTILKKNHILGV